MVPIKIKKLLLAVFIYAAFPVLFTLFEGYDPKQLRRAYSFLNSFKSSVILLKVEGAY